MKNRGVSPPLLFIGSDSLKRRLSEVPPAEAPFGGISAVVSLPGFP